MHAILQVLVAVGALHAQPARAECTATDCATCITQTEPGAVYGTSPCSFCASTGACTAGITASCVANAANSGWNDLTTTCAPQCPGNPNCPKCAAQQVAHSDKGTAAMQCPASEPGETCSVTCDTGFSGGGQMTCGTAGSGLTWSTLECSSVPAQQALLVSPPGCDWASLPARIAGAESACCLGLSADLPWPIAGGAVGSSCGASGPPACSVDCAIKLVPLVNGPGPSLILFRI